MDFKDYLQEQLQDPEFRKEYEALDEYYKTLKKLIRETEEKEKYSNTPSCGKEVNNE